MITSCQQKSKKDHPVIENERIAELQEPGILQVECSKKKIYIFEIVKWPALDPVTELDKKRQMVKQKQSTLFYSIL